jgi:prophage regulatory protein
MTAQINETAKPIVYVRWPEAKAQISLSRTTAWRGVRDGWFPKPVPISPRAVAWLQADIDAWKANPKAWAEANNEANNMVAGQKLPGCATAPKVVSPGRAGKVAVTERDAASSGA